MPSIRTVASFFLLAPIVAASVSHADSNADGEIVPRSEAGATARIVSQVREMVTKGQADEGRAHRDAHRKAHGCVKATFEVLPGLSPVLAVGVFGKPATYPATIPMVTPIDNMSIVAIATVPRDQRDP